MKEYEIVRMNIRVPDYIRDWYKEQGEKYSVPYTNYISMLLTQTYENEKNKELFQEFNQTMKQMKEMSGNVTAEEMMLEFHQMKKMFKELEDNPPTK